jgi:hypothetical protein
MSAHNVESLPQYPGDDTRPTSKRELAGWYCYGWAAEVFVVCAMGECDLMFSFTCLHPDPYLTWDRILSSYHFGADGSGSRCSALGQNNTMQRNLGSLSASRRPCIGISPSNVEQWPMHYLLSWR